MRQSPYIGITDVPSAEWLRQRFRVFQEAGAGELPYLLHAGVMMSYKWFHGLSDTYAAVWPKADQIEGIFIEDSRILNTLHYADYPDFDHPAPRTTVTEIEQILGWCGPHLGAIQFDMVWPRPELLDAVRGVNPSLRIILQVGSRALDALDNDVSRLKRRVLSYNGALDDVLLDPSGGRGIPMDADKLRPLVAALQQAHPELGITVAGGLGPDTLHLVEPLIRDFPGLSIDAQGQLRPSGKSTDPIDAERTDTYLRRAVTMYRAALSLGILI